MTTSATLSLPVCPCGEYAGEHPNVTVHPSYSLWGWFLLSFGVSGAPTKVALECPCVKKFFITKDPAILEKYV